MPKHESERASDHWHIIEYGSLPPRGYEKGYLTR
jgi:hypothetical protein